jgi:hypothetical protein
MIWHSALIGGRALVKAKYVTNTRYNLLWLKDVYYKQDSF